MRFVYFRQQLDVRLGVVLREPVPPVTALLQRTRPCVTSDQPRYLRPAQPGHFLGVAMQQSFGFLALLPVLLPAQVYGLASRTLHFHFLLQNGPPPPLPKIPGSVPGSTALRFAR